MQEILNIAAYKFVAIGDSPELREALRARTHALGLKGTILLAPEGINLFLAGAAASVHAFLEGLRADPRFADLEAKESWSASQPFRRMLVKCKREIIRMDHPAIQPAAGRAPGVDAPTLKRWLDQGHDDAGQPIALLDTRNAFEVDYGSFQGAIDWRIGKFTEFPKALARHRAELAGKTVVSFCTGGIRCEKAAILMRELGVQDVLQLEGGILKYFEQVGAAHYQGECFVFDGREALSPQLKARAGKASARAAEDPDIAIKQ
ncbi:MAG TPA: sulfurtransferase [Variovorax sp.]